MRIGPIDPPTLALPPGYTHCWAMFSPRAQNPALAIAFMLLATVFIAATTLIAKTLGTEAGGAPLHPLQISHGRYLFAWFAVVGIVAATGTPLRTRNLRLHATRALFGWAGVSLMFASVAFIPLSDATAISFLNPVFAMILAIPLLGERVGPIRWASAAIAMLGAAILLRPGPATFQPEALLALGAAFVLGVEIVAVKVLSGREPGMQILFYSNTIGLAFASAAVLPVWVAPSPWQWGGLAAIGLLMAAAQLCYVNALARADASLVVPFSYATLVFAALYDFAVFNVLPDGVSLIGAGIIIAGAALLAWREARLSNKSTR